MKIEAFRKMIREEVRTVIKEELSLIMSTTITENKIVKKPVVEQKTKKKQTFSEIINDEKQPQQPQKPTKPLFESKDPLAQILNETAADEWETMGGTQYTSERMGELVHNQKDDSGNANGSLATEMGVNPNDPSAAFLKKDYRELMNAVDKKQGK